uniref:Uncharacterized protein n=1 Tax=Rhizophagus irregularis (strain DAOM 181602 / DAOM 197198 / MUCL 43194) TaxID=747089 RepID=U9T4K8_RHIID
MSITKWIGAPRTQNYIETWHRRRTLVPKEANKQNIKVENILRDAQCNRENKNIEL